MGSSWAVDLKDIGAVYPWQGTEYIMVLVAVALWIIWQLWQMSFENQTYHEDMGKMVDLQKVKNAIDKDAGPPEG